MDLTLDYYGVSLLVGGFSALLFGIVVFLNNKKKYLNKVWLALTMSTAVWSFGYLIMDKKKASTVVIESEAVANAMKKLFDLAFEQAKQVGDYQEKERYKLEE